MSLLVHLSIPYPSYLATKSPCMIQNVESSAKISSGCPPVLQSTHCSTGAIRSVTSDLPFYLPWLCL